jgi:diaminopimelate decarboxylase
MNTIHNFENKMSRIGKMRDYFMDIAGKHGTPLYLFDREEVQNNVRNFKSAFKKQGVDINIFYATKSNYYPGLLKTVVEEGENLDVSSARELELAIEAGAKRIIYTGPAKTEKDFELILKHHSKITVNLESIRELELLAKMAKTKKVIVRCGIRIHSAIQAGWTKFGIPMEDFADFFHEAQKYPSIHFCGIHFHISFNKNPEKYVKMLEELSLYLKKHLTEKEGEEFEYIDIGGGFYPHQFQSFYAWNVDQYTNIPEGVDYINDIFEDKFVSRTLPLKTEDIDVFAKQIVSVFKKKILPALPKAALYAEPGRFISHSSMHFLLNMVDIKNDRMGITDGSGNMIGWELYQYYYYAPLFNLSQFDTKNEIPFITCGSLCTPDDIWGYYIYTKKTPKAGDILLMPYQGAYTYTLAQNFIKEVPPVLDI